MREFLGFRRRPALGWQVPTALWWAGGHAERRVLVSEEPGSCSHRLMVLAHRGAATTSSVLGVGGEAAGASSAVFVAASREHAPMAATPTASSWENTLAAFAAARSLGADGVELDVRLTADGAAVVIHDPILADGEVVATLTRAQLPGWIPTLDEALDACGAVLVDIEVKNAPTEAGFDAEQRLADTVMATLRRRSARAEGQRWLVTSFWPDTVAALSAARSRILPEGLDGAWASSRPGVGLLLHPSLDPSGLVERAVMLGCDTLLPWWEGVSAGWVAEAHRVGLQVMAWTVNDAEALGTVVLAGVDGVITDDVGAALAFRQRWAASKSIPPAQ